MDIAETLSTEMVSLRGGFLRLMMAGAVYVGVGSMSFLLGFAVTEVIALLSVVSEKEVNMAKRIFGFVRNRPSEPGRAAYSLTGPPC
jgi:membrane protein implicated in regulation of membrane protease activity